MLRGVWTFIGARAIGEFGDTPLKPLFAYLVSRHGAEGNHREQDGLCVRVAGAERGAAGSRGPSGLARWMIPGSGVYPCRPLRSPDGKTTALVGGGRLPGSYSQQCWRWLGMWAKRPAALLFRNIRSLTMYKAGDACLFCFVLFGYPTADFERRFLNSPPASRLRLFSKVDAAQAGRNYSE
jgi:hypothetical protein